MSHHDRAVRDWMITVGAVHVVVVGLQTVAITSPAPSSTSPPLSLPTVSWADQVDQPDHAGAVAQ